MSVMSDRRLWIVALGAAMLGVQWAYPTQSSVIWPPLLLTIAIAFFYRKEIRSYRWAKARSGVYWMEVFQALTQAMIGQAIGIVAVTYGLGVVAPAVGIELTLAVVASAVLLSAVIEETLYRGILYGGLERHLGFWPAAAISSFLFAAAHHNYAAWLGYFIQGLIWCRVYKRTRDISILILAHLLFNAIYFVVSYFRG